MRGRPVLIASAVTVAISSVVVGRRLAIALRVLADAWERALDDARLEEATGLTEAQLARIRGRLYDQDAPRNVVGVRVVPDR